MHLILAYNIFELQIFICYWRVISQTNKKKILIVTNTHYLLKNLPFNKIKFVKNSRFMLCPFYTLVNVCNYQFKV